MPILNPSMDSVASVNILTNQADAYASFATISALVFGFSVSALWGSKVDKSGADQTSIIFLCITITLSSWSLVIHSIQYYVFKEFVASKSIEKLNEWLYRTRKMREGARYSLWLSLGFFMLSTITQLISRVEHQGGTEISIYLGVIILSLGLIAILCIVLFMRPKYMFKNKSFKSQIEEGGGEGGTGV
jgi:H+/gluconate symporter-like permease